MKERDRLKDLDVDGKVILKWILREEDEVMWTAFVCSKKGPSSGILWTWHCTRTIGFCIMVGIPRLAEEISASWKLPYRLTRLCFMELVR